ncbi:MAG: hypothetical protein LBT51_07600 [Fusobacteriaceae bacterium]|jgi:hypothetical protein|nr:hypothetical protein [Fusobacteriaceae bacterium]
MKNIKKFTKLFIFCGVILIAVSGFSRFDVVGKDSIRAFDKVLETLPDNVKPDEMNGGWALKAPDGGARFIWSSDYSKSFPHDIMLEIDAMPFIDAGLDTSKLPEDMFFYEGMIMIGVKLGENVLKYKGTPTPLSSYEHIVNLYRKVIGYHAALDHYGVTIGAGNLFEWAKDQSTNDKDIVFVLNPEPFIAAGVDPNKITGWVFGKVSVDIDGKPVEVDKLLKPFNLK